MRRSVLLFALLLTPTAAAAGVRVPADLSETPGPHLATAPLAWTGVDAPPQAASAPHLLYINFDGAVLRRGCGNDSRHDCSSLADLFDGYVGPFVGTESRRLAIVQAVRKDLADFGVRTVTTRPAAETDYTMVLYGDLGEQSFAGIAPYIDCGNLWANDTCFAGAFQGSNIGSTIILQEAAHTWGLEHVNSPFDNLHPFVAQATPRFQDQCNKIVSNTDLVEISGVCNQVHTKFCDPGSQNSYQELLYLFGPALPDTSPPTLDITSPEEGSFHVLPTTLRLQGEVHDDLEPQFYQMTVTNNGETVFSDQVIRLDLALKDPPPGDYDLTVRLVTAAVTRSRTASASPCCPRAARTRTPIPPVTPTAPTPRASRRPPTAAAGPSPPRPACSPCCCSCLAVAAAAEATTSPAAIGPAARRRARPWRDDAGRAKSVPRHASPADRRTPRAARAPRRRLPASDQPRAHARRQQAGRARRRPAHRQRDR